MRKAYIIIFISLISLASFCQSAGHVVFNSTGGSIGDNGAVHMVLSVGEPAIGLNWSGTQGLAQGFLGGSKTVAANPSGIEVINDENAVVYPNPFSNYIKINTGLDNIHVSVYSTMGQQVYDGGYQGTGIDLSQLAPGIYMVHVTSDQQSISNTKLLKQ